jgi:hypothetical protein
MGLPQTPDVDELDADEIVRMRAWRALQFERLGFAAEDVELLVEAGVDHHVAEAILRRGCSLEIARAILL